MNRAAAFIFLCTLSTVINCTVAAPALAAIKSTFSAPQNLGAPIRQVAIFDSAYDIVDGQHRLYTTNNGEPAEFMVVDLFPFKLRAAHPLPGSSNVWAHLVGNDGSVYIGANGSGKMYRYLPATDQVQDLGQPISSEKTIWAFAKDDAGNIYGGTYPNGKVFRFNPNTAQVTDYGTVVPGQSYVHSIAYANGYIYAGIGQVGSLVKMDPVNGKKVTIPAPNPSFAKGDITSLDVRGNYLFVFGPESTLYILDLRTDSWLSTTGNKGYRGLFVSPELNGKVYFVANNMLHTFSLSDQTIEPTNISFGTYIRHATWLDLPNNPMLPGPTLVTVQYGGQVSFINLQTKKVINFPLGHPGGALPIQSLEAGPDGRLYLSAYLGAVGVQFNPVTNSSTTFSLGQSEGMTSLGNAMYMGVYPKAEIYRVDTRWTPYAEKLRSLGEEQDRPFAMTSGDNKLFIGTVPTYGRLGGALTIYDPAKYKWAVYRNVVQNQSIVGLTYRDGKVYGSTSVWGGLGIVPTATAATIFVWDVASGSKTAEVTLQTPGTAAPKAIGQLSFGPDGKLWAAAQGSIFVLNPDTLAIERFRAVYPSNWNLDHSWRPVYLRWGNDGLLYTTLGSQLTVIDPATLESVKLDDTSLMTLSQEGNIFYTKGSSLYKITVKKPDSSK